MIALTKNMKGLISSIVFTLLLLACNSNEQVTNEMNTPIANDMLPVIITAQSADYILGDKLLLSKLADTNGLTSPDTITVLGEFEDSIAAVRKMKQLLRKDSAVQILNTENYHYTDKAGNYILYKQAIRDLNESRYWTYPKTYRPDGNVEIYQIRRNNFDADLNLAAFEIPIKYSAYDVAALIDSSIMYIEQKRYYSEARPFSRFIKFNSNNKQVNTLTLNDYRLQSVLEMPNNQLLITLAKAEFGARFNYSVATAKLIVIDRELNILNEMEVFYEGAVVTEMLKKEQSYYLGLKFHVLCSDCNLHHCYFKIELDENLEEQNVEITSLPTEIHIPIDSVLNNLRIIYPIK
jgi:hypothetical protein